MFFCKNGNYITQCRICSSSDLEKFLDLGDQPWCNNFVRKEEVGKEKVYPLHLCFCKNCSAVQLDYTVPKEVMYSDHFYLSGTTKSMALHFQQVSKRVRDSFVSKGLVVDIGSNDGTLLKQYKNLGFEVLGVEPCERSVEKALADGVSTLISFFDYECADNILKNYGKAQVISAANVFYHLEDLHDITKAVKYLLDRNGVFVVHGSYLFDMLRMKHFDIIYHEHLLYYRLYSLNYLLKQYDLEIFDVDMYPDIHGGSFVAYICPKENRKISGKVTHIYEEEMRRGMATVDIYYKFAEAVKQAKENIVEVIGEVKNRNETVYAFGAPAKGTVLLNYCQLNNQQIDLAVERNNLKFGYYIPCTGVPIRNEMSIEEPDYYLLLAWNFVDEFCRSPEFLSGKRKFIVPLPEAKVVKNG